MSRTDYTIDVLEAKILDLLAGLRAGKRYGSTYFTVVSPSEEDIIIRVSDHSGNRLYNKDRRIISFITQATEQRKSGYNRMVEEYVIDEDGYAETYQSLRYILNEEIF